MDIDRAIALITARCPELEPDLAEIEAAISGRAPPVMLDKDMAERLMTVIDVIERRLDEMTAALDERAIAQELEASFIDAAGETLQ